MSTVTLLLGESLDAIRARISIACCAVRDAAAGSYSAMATHCSLFGKRLSGLSQHLFSSRGRSMDRTAWNRRGASRWYRHQPPHLASNAGSPPSRKRAACSLRPGGRPIRVFPHRRSRAPAAVLHDRLIHTTACPTARRRGRPAGPLPPQRSGPSRIPARGTERSGGPEDHHHRKHFQHGRRRP